MSSKYVPFIAAVAAVLGTAVASEPRDGLDSNTLLDICTTGDALQKGYRLGYMVGYREGSASNWHTARRSGIAGGETTPRNAAPGDARLDRRCIPPSLPHHQMRDVVIDYIVKHPEVRYERAGSLIATSLQVAFPCESES